MKTTITLLTALLLASLAALHTAALSMQVPFDAHVKIQREIWAGGHITSMTSHEP